MPAKHPIFDPNGLYRLASRESVWEDGGVESVRRFFHARTRRNLREVWLHEVPSEPQDWGFDPKLNQLIHEHLVRQSQAAKESAAPAAVVHAAGHPELLPTPALVIANLGTISEHTGPALAVAVLPDGRIVSGGSDRTVKVWNPQTGRVDTMDEHTDRVNALAVLPDGRIVSGSHDKTVKVWDPQTGRVDTMDAHTDAVGAVAVLPDGRIVSGSRDKTVKVWDPQTGRVDTMDEHTDRVNALAVLPDGRIVSGSHDKTVKVWDPQTGRLDTMGEHASAVFPVAVFPDGRIVSGGADNIVRIWDTQTGSMLARIENGGSVQAVAVLSHGRILVAGDKTARIWDSQTAHIVTTFENTGGIRAVAVASDGRIVLGSVDETLKIWDPHSGEVHSTNELELAARRPPLRTTEDAFTGIGSQRIGKIKEFMVDIPDLIPAHRYVALIITRELLESLALQLEMDEPAGHDRQSLAVLRRLLEPAQLDTQRNEREQSRRAFLLASSLALAPGLEGITTAAGRFQQSVKLDRECPGLESGTIVLACGEG